MVFLRLLDPTTRNTDQHTRHPVHFRFIVSDHPRQGDVASLDGFKSSRLLLPLLL